MKVLEGKIALITGVGRKGGIGFALAEELGKKGSRIFATYYRPYDQELGLSDASLSTEALLSALKEQGIEATFFEMDLRQKDAAEKIFDEVERVYGVPHFLINNACVSKRYELEEITAEELDEHYFVNHRAPLLLCREFVKRFKEETGGKIINMTSGQSVSIMEGELPYTTTKAGLEMMTTQLAFSLRERGITMNAVDPGPTDTGWITHEIRKAIVNSPTGNVINTPGEVASVVSTFITGEREAQTGMVLHMNQTELKL